jgi:hypothetical protein
MGLDIYFNGRNKKSRELEFELAYFRKVNCLVGWVEKNVANVENCGQVILRRDDLKDLLNDAKSVQGALKTAEMIEVEVVTGIRKDENGEWVDKKEKANVYSGLATEAAMTLLPPTPGFFFGTTTIDSCYSEQIDYIVQQIAKILEEVDFAEEEVVFTCWW